MAKIEIIDTSHNEHGEVASPKAESSDWQIVAVKSRVDAFNQEALKEEIENLRKNGYRKIALDLKANRFLSFPVIKHCVEISREVASSGGSFALIGCAERTKRHFEIYGTLDHIDIVRAAGELPKLKK